MRDADKFRCWECTKPCLYVMMISLEVERSQVVCDDDKFGRLEVYRIVCDDDKFGDSGVYTLCAMMIRL